MQVLNWVIFCLFYLKKDTKIGLIHFLTITPSLILLFAVCAGNSFTYSSPFFLDSSPFFTYSSQPFLKLQGSSFFGGGGRGGGMICNPFILFPYTVVMLYGKGGM